MNGVTTFPRKAMAWRRRLPLRLRKGRLAALVEGVTLALFLGIAGLTYHLLSSSGGSYSLLTPPIVALLLVANLVPAIALLVLLGRRVAKRRAAASAIGSDGQLHVRLVAIFSIVASVPMLLVVIFASLLFQYGVQFWFSDSARGMLQNAGDLARGYYEQNLREVSDETVTMADDLRDYLGESPVSSPRFAEGYIYQVVTRKLNRSAIVEVGKDGIARTAAIVDPENRPASEMLWPEAVERLAKGENIVVRVRPNQVEAVTLLYPKSKVYLYATRDAVTTSFSNVERAQKVIADYDQFSAQSRALQLRFNIALFVGSLLLVGIAVYIALTVADWMVRPVNELVTAARRITAGDLSARVTSPQSRDEIGTLASAFNRMTQRLEAQTGALVAASGHGWTVSYLVIAAAMAVGPVTVLAVPPPGRSMDPADYPPWLRPVDEASLLKAFWVLAGQADVVVTYNGRNFDVPFLVARSLVHGVPARVDLLGNPYNLRPHLDLYRLIQPGRALGPSGLEVVCWALGIESPKGALDGSQVGPAYARGELEAIARYNRGDVLATAAVYRRVRDGILQFRQDW